MIRSYHIKLCHNIDSPMGLDEVDKPTWQGTQGGPKDLRIASS